MKKKITNYEAPQLTVVEFRLERGFATSGVFGAVETVNCIINEETSMIASQDQQGNLVAGYMDGQAIDNSGDPVGTGWEYQNGGYF